MGDVIGKIRVIEGNNVIMEVDATIDKNVDKANIFLVFYRNFIDMIKGTI